MTTEPTTPGTVAINVEVPRAVFEDKPILEFVVTEQWRLAIERDGGQPVDAAPAITEGPKRLNGQDIPASHDDAGWDTITMRAVGAANPPGGQPAAPEP